MTVAMPPRPSRPFHRNPDVVGCSEKQKRIWEAFRRMPAFRDYDGFVGGFEIDSNSIYQSILNMVFEVAEDGSPDAALLSALDTLPEFRAIRSYVYGDPINAGMSFLGLMPTVQRILLATAGGGGGEGDEEPDEDEDGQPGGGGQPGEDNGEDGKDEGKGGKGKGGGDKSLSEKIKDYVEENREELAEELSDGNKEGRSAAGFSIDGEGAEIELANHMFGHNADIRKLMAVIGALTAHANAAIRDKRKNVPGEVTDITEGQDFSRLLSSGFMEMVTPELEDMFWIRWAQNEQPITEVRGYEREGRGPLVILVDESGSMTDDCEGMMLHDWARAISLTLAASALKSHRPVHVVKFSSVSRGHRLRGGRKGFNQEDFRWMTARPDNGGTNIIHALEQGFMAVNQINKENHKSGARADIVLITDFTFRLSGSTLESIQAEKKRSGTQVFGIVIGKELPEYAVQSMQDICDETHAVTTLADTKTLMSAARFVSPK